MSELELIGGVVFKRNSCGQPLSTPQLFERYAALRARVAELEAGLREIYEFAEAPFSTRKAAALLAKPEEVER